MFRKIFEAGPWVMSWVAVVLLAIGLLQGLIMLVHSVLYIAGGLGAAFYAVLWRQHKELTDEREDRESLVRQKQSSCDHFMRELERARTHLSVAERDLDIVAQTLENQKTANALLAVAIESRKATEAGLRAQIHTQADVYRSQSQEIMSSRESLRQTREELGEALLQLESQEKPDKKRNKT